VSTAYYPPLHHQLIAPFEESMMSEEWRAFIRANTKRKGEWQEWDEYPGGVRYGRFFGTDISLSRFKIKAERGMEILRRISQMRNHESVILPEGLILDLPSDKGYQGWILLLYETGRAYSTPVLSAVPAYWGCTGQVNGNEEMVLHTTPEGIRYPVHPFFEELRSNLFACSAEAIRLWLSPTEEVAETTSESLVKRLQGQLADFPAEIHTKGEYIWLECYKPKR
jgi:hypothetical protein